MSEPLLTLHEQAERERDAAQAALMQAGQVLQRLQQQAEQLLAYRGDYLERGPGRVGRSAPIEVLHCHHAFMLRLDQALQQLRAQLLDTQARVEQARAALLERETRLAAVRKLLERRARDERQAAARLEQRRVDEAAMQRAWRLGAAAMPLAR